MSDFVAIVEQLTCFIQNERISSYNEGVDTLLDNARTWMAAHNIPDTTGDHAGICDLLNAVDDHYYRESVSSPRDAMGFTATPRRA